jgi:hypothetical protein
MNKPVLAAKKPAATKYASEEQMAYAAVLQVGMRTSLVLIVAAFVATMLGLLPLTVPASEMPRYWSMSAPDYLNARHMLHGGLPWVQQLLQGDLIFAGIALMAAVTVYCYAYFLRFPLRNKDRVLTAIVIAEICVLSLAASGILAGGGH